MSNINLANGASGEAISAAQASEGRVIGTGSNLFISDDMVSELREAYRDEGKSHRHFVKLFDALDKAGWSPSHFIAVGADGSTATEETWKRAQEMVKVSLPKQVQTLLALPAEAAKGQVAADWSGNAYTAKGQPKDRRFWMQQVGAMVAAIGRKWSDWIKGQEAKADYLKFQALIAAGDTEAALALKSQMDEAGQRKTVSPDEYLDEAFDKAIKRAEKFKGGHVDLVLLKAYVTKAQAEYRAFLKTIQL